jgi:hypothetical protein
MQMIKKYFKFGLLSFFGSVILINIAAQGGVTGITAPGHQNRIITESQKEQLLPATRDTAIQIPDVKYYVEPTQYPVDFEVEPIEAAKLKVVEPLEKLYPGYVKFGVGNYTMPYLDAYYGSLRSKKNSWGVNVKHHSALGQINDVGTSKFSENYLDGFYKHFLKNHTLKTDLYYHRDVNHYYGFDINDSLIPSSYRENEDSIRQGYNWVGFKTLLSSNYKDSSKLHHQVGVSYYYLNNFDKLQEHNVVANTTLSKYLENENIEANVDFGIDFNSLNQPLLSPIDTFGVALPSQSDGLSNSAIVRFVPYVVNNKILNKLHFKGGFGVNIDIADVNKFYFYPEVELSYDLFNSVFIPYAGATGGVQRNSWNNLRLDNPFLLSNSFVQNTNEKINVYGGIRGAISSSLSFNLNIRYQKFNDKVLYYNDTIFGYENGFAILYDNVGVTTFSGQLAYQKSDKFMMFLKGEYFINKSEVQEFAWLMPDFNLSLNATYDLADKIIARANVFVVGNRNTFSLDSIAGITPNDANQFTQVLKPYLDANLGLEYRYNKRISAFINFNNLTAAKYQQFTKYPVQRFNVLGGFTFKF